MSATRPAPFWQRLAWLAAIWFASVAALGVVALIIRLVLRSPTA